MSSHGGTRDGKGGSERFPKSSDKSSSGISEHPTASEKSFHDEDDVSLSVHHLIDNWITKSSKMSSHGVPFHASQEKIVWKDSKESPDIQKKCIQYLEDAMDL